jgi:hypothetical protein
MAGRDDHVHMIRSDLPLFVIGQTAMWQRGLAPAGIEEANSGVVVSHVGGSGFDGSAVRLKKQSALPPVMLDQIMNRPHNRP